MAERSAEIVRARRKRPRSGSASASTAMAAPRSPRGSGSSTTCSNSSPGTALFDPGGPRARGSASTSTTTTRPRTSASASDRRSTGRWETRRASVAMDTRSCRWTRRSVTCARWTRRPGVLGVGRPDAVEQDRHRFDSELVADFWQAVASQGRMNLHVLLHYGRNTHHISEAIFKGLARTLRSATEIDPRVVGVPSTKARPCKPRIDPRMPLPDAEGYEVSPLTRRFQRGAGWPSGSGCSPWRSGRTG